uniref:Lon protease n=1 Tax=Lygus hesperus TaxID=30085 RepID=A0A0A9W9E9_LYGHE
MFYRNFEGLDEVRRGSFVELSGRLLQKNRSDSAEVSRQTSDRYVKKHMSAGVTEPLEVDYDVKRISFVSKANDIFQRSSVPKNTRSEPSFQKIPVMEKQRKISTQTSGSWPPKYLQSEGLPQFEQLEPEPLHPTKREAELESAVKILSMKLDYTQRKIVESQNNKEILKAKLDHLITVSQKQDMTLI